MTELACLNHTVWNWSITITIRTDVEAAQQPDRLSCSLEWFAWNEWFQAYVRRPIYFFMWHQICWKNINETRCQLAESVFNFNQSRKSWTLLLFPDPIGEVFTLCSRASPYTSSRNNEKRAANADAQFRSTNFAKIFVSLKKTIYSFFPGIKFQAIKFTHHFGLSPVRAKSKTLGSVEQKTPDFPQFLKSERSEKMLNNNALIGRRKASRLKYPIKGTVLPAKSDNKELLSNQDGCRFFNRQSKSPQDIVLKIFRKTRTGNFSQDQWIKWYMQQ